MRDPYQVLGLSKTASQDDIKKAYRKLAKDLHPDLHPGDKKVEERFKEVSAAYHLLSDPEKRRRYDRGEIDASGQERPERHFYRTYAEGEPGAKYGFGEGVGAEDIFADLFGGFGRGRGGARIRMPGADVTYTMQVGFHEAVLGARRRVTLPGGRSIDLTIPPGTENGQTLRLKGQGQPGIGGGPPGDAYIRIDVSPHPLFERRGHDVHVEMPVTLQEAVLGGQITVPTVDGKVTVTVPKGSNTGTTLRLRGKGVPRRTGRRGDQFVHLRVMLPERPDPELTEFVRRWGESHPYEVRKKTQSA